MTIEQIDSKLKELSTTCSVDQAKALVDSLVSLLGINETKNKELLAHRSIDREVTRFVSAPMLRNQAAAYNIPHESGEPIDLKLFWVKNTTKANLSWLVALTPNYEDDPVNNENANLGIDFVLSESCDRLYIILSYKLKLRVLELHETLSYTQKEILDNWSKIRKELDPTSDTYKEQLRSHLWNSFDFEPVNKFFYSQLIQQFDHLVSHLKASNMPEEEAKMFAVKLFGRTLFLWFLRKKEFLNPKIHYFEVDGVDGNKQTKYYQEFLEPLFFEVLNSEIRGRKYPDEITPFLNGGLFEPTETDFYKDTTLTFPDGFFTQFYALLNKFNFTVDEGTSDYEQVAVDPEMLGRVFENLLASINPETETSARKAKGAFYTPRSIVDYMCEQSLIEYLKTKLPESSVRDQRIEELVTMNESDFREQDHNKRRDWKRDLGKENVVKALDELKVLDPAVGSGAFPMGMLQLLVKVYSRIETTNEKNPADLKRKILSRSLYGVDIDQMAIQISRLRAWLSILVDMQDLRRVEPLPNLDFKFVCANTLIPLAEGSQDNLFDEHELKEDLIEIRDKYYEATTKTSKKKLREQYLEKIQDGGIFAELESERQRQLKNYNPFNSLNSSGFYDASLMHGVENFEVVIGNPPYITIGGKQDARTTEQMREALSNIYSSYSYKANFFVLFTEKAIKLSCKNSIITFIVPRSLSDNNRSDKARSFILDNTHILTLVELRDKVFENAETGGNVIFLLKKKEGVTSDDGHLMRVGKVLDYNDIVNTVYIEKQQSEFEKSEGKEFSINTEGDDQILQKIKEAGVPLDSICIVKNGVNTGNAAKILLNESNESEKHRKILEGKNITKYAINWGGLWINYDDTLKKTIDLSKLDTRQKKIDFALRDLDNFLSKKIIIRQTADKPIAALDEESYISRHSTHIILPREHNLDLVHVLGVLNSSLVEFYYQHMIPEKGKTFAELKVVNLKKLPIRIVPSSRVSELVSKIIRSKTEDLSRDTSALETEIDELVMDLYSLTEEEKEIIRNS